MGWVGWVCDVFFLLIYKIFLFHISFFVFCFVFFLFFSIAVKNAHAVLPQWDQICAQNGRFGA